MDDYKDNAHIFTSVAGAERMEKVKKNKIKKIFIILFVLIILLCLYVFHYNNNAKITIANLIKKGTLHSGDLVYRMNLFGVIPVADAVFEAEGLHLNATLAPLGKLQKFFKAYAVLDSHLDSLAGNPLSFKQKITIPGKPQITKEVSYDQKKLFMTIGEVRRQILPNTQDPLSAMFNIRRMNLEGTSSLEMNINTNQKNYLFEAKTSAQDISLKHNTYRLFFLKAEIRRRDKNPYHKSLVDIVLIKSGKENIPVLIKIFASGFFLSAKLVEIR